MQGQIDNKLISSFMLFIDNLILSNGNAFQNISGIFRPQTSLYSNYYIYGIPYAQLVYDSSVAGTNVQSGIYLNNTFITTGESGFIGINYEKGQAIFNTNQNNYVISGYCTLKDFNIKITNEPEETILFETKYQLKPRFPQTATGIPDTNVTYPCIWIRDDGGENTPFALGGLDKATHNIKCIILSDTLFNLHAVQSIFRNSARTPVALFEPSEMPFTSLGTLKSGVYNYSGVKYNKLNENNYAFIEKVRIPRRIQNLTVESKLLNPDIFFNIVDFEVSLFGHFGNC